MNLIKHLENENQITKDLQKKAALLYLPLYLIFHIILGFAAYFNNIWADYQLVVLFTLLPGFFAISIVLALEGQDEEISQRGESPRLVGLHRLVFYAACLFSLGQLVQSIVYHSDEGGFETYQAEFHTTVIVMIIMCIVLVYFFRFLVGLIPHNHTLYKVWRWIFQLILVAATIGLLLFLWKSPAVNGAHLNIKIGPVSFQAMELVKPLSVLVVAGFMYKPKLGNLQIFFAICYVGFVAVFCSIICNEFGTGLIVLLVGTIIIFVSQRAVISWVSIALPALVIIALLCVIRIGNGIYARIPQQVSDEVFAQEFTACCENRDELAETISAYIAERESDGSDYSLEDEEHSITVLLNEKDVPLSNSGFTYDWFVKYLYGSVQNKYIATSYMKDEKLEDLKSFTKAEKTSRHNFLTYMTAICHVQNSYSNSFRSFYYETILSRMVYKDRFLEAYDKLYNQNTEVMSEEVDSEISEQSSEQEKANNTGLKGIIFKYYCSAIYKIQYRTLALTDPEGQAQKSAYQINSAMGAMATGGWWGNGSIHYTTEIPEADSDMVFASAVSELGTFAGVAIILLSMMMFKEMIFAALSMGSLYLEEICAGMGLTCFIQALVVILGNCRLSILTGMTLPLIANGRMSLLDTAAMITLVVFLSLDEKTRKIFEREEFRLRHDSDHKNQKGKNKKKRKHKDAEDSRQPNEENQNRRAAGSRRREKTAGIFAFVLKGGNSDEFHEKEFGYDDFIDSVDDGDDDDVD